MSQQNNRAQSQEQVLKSWISGHSTGRTEECAIFVADGCPRCESRLSVDTQSEEVITASCYNCGTTAICSEGKIVNFT